MKLYFVRHGTAARKTTWREDDDLRPLTRAGRARFRSAAKSLAAAGVLAPERILTSPLVRATQTADILSKILGGETPPEVEPRLGHTFGVDDLRILLAQKPRINSIAIIGHNPSLCEVLSAITGGCNVDLRKGAVALVEITDARMPAGRLMWLVPPTILATHD